MKQILSILFCILAVTLQAQFAEEKKTPSKHEIGMEFRGTQGAFLPNLTYNYYRSENNILHFSPLIRLGGNTGFARLGDLNFGSYGIDFWNEYRRYLRRNSNFYFSHGFTLSAGYSHFDYSEFISSNAKGNSIGVGAGYKLGFGYKINDHFTLNLNANPRILYSRTDYNLKNRNQFSFQMPLSFGLNYRF